MAYFFEPKAKKVIYEMSAKGAYSTDVQTTMHSKPAALITGASRGLGEEFCRLFAADGYDLVLVSRDEERMKTLKAALERKHHARRIYVVVQDLAQPGAAAVLSRWLEENGIVLEALVNNAGFGDTGAFSQADAARIRQMLQLNVIALTELTRAVLPGMLARSRGKILNVSSVAAFQPGPLMATYYATKAYVLSLSAALTEEVRGTGVTVTCLCPGPTRTGFAKAAHLEKSLLFGGKPMGLADAATVARIGYRGMLDGKNMVIPGMRSRIGTYLARVAPLSWSARIAMRVHKSMGGA